MSAVAKTRESRRTIAEKFLARIPWDEWWQEFATALDPRGQLRFRTAWQFAKEKGRNTSEREMIYCAIGPKRAEQVWLDGSNTKRFRRTIKRKVPWLGNWQLRRDNLLYYNRESVRKMHNVIKERLDALEAGRGAATVVLDWLAKLTKWSDDVDRFFGHTLLVPGGGKNGQLTKATKERTNYYLRLQAMLFDSTNVALQQYLRCHGIADNDLSVLAQMAAVGARAALAGAAAGQRLAETNPTVYMLATSIAQKAQLLGIEPPTKVVDVEAEEAEETVIPPASSGHEPARPSGRGSKVVH